MSYSQGHLNETIEIIKKIDIESIENVVDLLVKVRDDSGRIFFLGVGA